nr:ulp1 protease family, C-terminal catalytic domain-containing protein [Tanacetum cinerariifolium]
DDGWDEVIVPKPTDKVKTLKDVKGGQFIQWPRKYIKVLRKMPSNDSMSLPTSIPPLTSLTTSTPVLCQMLIYIQMHVQQELPSQATTSWSGSKTITLTQEEDDTTKKCMEVLPAWTSSKIAIPTQNGNNTIQECIELLLRRPAEIQRLASKFIERPERDDQILVMSYPGMYVERFFKYVEYSSLLAWMANSWLDGTLIHWWAMLQEDFSVDEDMSPIVQKHIDEWVLSSTSQFFTFYLEN